MSLIQTYNLTISQKVRKYTTLKVTKASLPLVLIPGGKPQIGEKRNTSGISLEYLSFPLQMSRYFLPGTRRYSHQKPNHECSRSSTLSPIFPKQQAIPVAEDMLLDPLLLRHSFCEKTPVGSVIPNGKFLLVIQRLIRATGTGTW